MSNAFTVRTLAALAAVALSFGAFAAQARLGFAVAASTDGFIESINDVRIAGADGSKIMDMVHAVQPGGHLKLTVLRGGVEHVVDIVGGAAK